VCDDQSSPTRRRFRRHAMVSQTARRNHPTAQPDPTQTPPSRRQLTARTTFLLSWHSHRSPPFQLNSSLRRPYTLRHRRLSNECLRHDATKRPPLVERRLSAATGVPTHTDQHRRIRSADGRSGRIVCLQGSTQEGPVSRPKPPFRCERETGLATTKMEETRGNCSPPIPRANGTCGPISSSAHAISQTMSETCEMRSRLLVHYAP
jgi:hypothetical protein